jgi:sugar lactone lactonase YvrE
MKAKLIRSSTQLKLGESPVWRNGELYYVDILGGKIHAYNGSVRTLYSDKIIPFIVPCSDGLVFGTRDSIRHLSFTRMEVKTLFTVKLQENVRFNDGKCDKNGFLFAGTMDMNEKMPSGSLYRFGTGQETVLENITISNGTIWDPDIETMYYIDSPTRKIRVFDYDVNKSTIISERKSFDVSSFAGVPDGMTLDSQGNLYVAFFGGNGIIKFNRSGEAVKKIFVGTKNVTSCIFGDDDMKTLYITTASDKINRGGHLYKFRNDVPGLPSMEFKFLRA